jgi:hypothetical protein
MPCGGFEGAQVNEKISKTLKEDENGLSAYHL